MQDGLTSNICENNKTLMRIDKFLADVGIGSRTDVKKLIKRGSIKVNDVLVSDPAFKVSPRNDIVSYNGENLLYEQYVYLLMNKPKGVICATEDIKHSTVLDLIPDEFKHFNVVPVGRLDIDTTGLLMLTNDGDLNHKLLSPKYHVIKKYEAVLYENKDVVLNDDTVNKFKEGIVIGANVECLPAKLEIISQDVVYLSLVEGKFHQVKKMMKAIGREVKELKRIQFAGLSLDNDFKEGTVYKLSKQELEIIKKNMGKKLF